MEWGLISKMLMLHVFFGLSNMVDGTYMGMFLKPIHLQAQKD
jgi:hypothetical protein